MNDSNVVEPEIVFMRFVHVVLVVWRASFPSGNWNSSGTNCAPLLANLFLHSYENEFLDNMIRGGHRRLARSFNLCYRYIDNLIVFNNKKFLDYLKEIYPS